MASDLFADFFDDPESWTVFASGLSEGRLTCDKGPDGKSALRLDYDFHEGKGFVVARKVIEFALPPTFQFQFCLKGEGPNNRFEFKIIDPSGADVWRALDEKFDPANNWTGYRITERELPFAWGPEGGGAPKVVGAIELVIAAGEGGCGSVSFSDLSLEDETLYLPKKSSASSYQANYPPRAVFLTGAPSGWRAKPGDPAPQWWVDFGRMVRFGGLVIHWPAPLPPREFEIEISPDNKQWTGIFKAHRATGSRTHIPAPGAEARYLRMNFASAETAAICSLELRPDSFSHTRNDFMHAVAAEFPRGWFPRYWCHEQSYWTPVGSPEGGKRALINEEGLLETDEAGFSLEPFLVIGGKLVTWADAETEVSLTDGGAPFPVVTWQYENTKLVIMPWVDGSGDSLALRVTYRLENSSGHDIRLVAAARPFQVNPPWQAFRKIGGLSPIHAVDCDAMGMLVEGRRVFSNPPPDASGAGAFEEEGIVEFLSRGLMPDRGSIRDESGLGSAGMAWDVACDVESFEITLTVPFFKDAPASVENARELALARWHEILATVTWEVPAIAEDAIRCFRTAASHILINRDGSAIQPGPRRYTRSWVRDCVIMGAAMSKAGQPQLLRDFLLWYRQFQREDGSIPAVVDRDGVDPLVEHDSHGQFLWGVCEVHRVGGDMAFLQTLWPYVQKAADHLIVLREQCLTPEFCSANLVHYHGLLPESASHEGYLAQPVHSYWDDFWGVRGLEAASELAVAAGMSGDAKRWHGKAREFLNDVKESIGRVIIERQIEYIPGSVEWADFDPTATANAIAQLDFSEDLPAEPLQKMLAKYLEDFRKKHRGEMTWLNYTAYEIRIVGAFARIGKRDEANELLEFFLSDRRPLPWNQWPEISWRDPRSPGHLGDVPHTWIAAEYMLALVSMIASEREGAESMVLASGLPWKWIAEENGFAVKGLGTRFGKLDFSMSADSVNSIHFEIGAGISIPAGGLSVVPPLPAGTGILTAMAEGKALVTDRAAGSIAVTRVPISATLTYGPTAADLA